MLTDSVTRIVKIRIIFGVRFERRKVDKKSKRTRKLKHTNSVLVCVLLGSTYGLQNKGEVASVILLLCIINVLL